MSESVIQDMRYILGSAVYHKNISPWTIHEDQCWPETLCNKVNNCALHMVTYVATDIISHSTVTM